MKIINPVYPWRKPSLLFFLLCLLLSTTTSTSAQEAVQDEPITKEAGAAPTPVPVFVSARSKPA